MLQNFKEFMRTDRGQDALVESRAAAEPTVLGLLWGFASTEPDFSNPTGRKEVGKTALCAAAIGGFMVGAPVAIEYVAYRLEERRADAVYAQQYR